MQINRPIASAVIFFAVLLLGFFFISPVFSEYRVLQGDLAQKQGEYDAKAAYYSEIAKVYDKISANKDIISKIDSAIPSNVSYGPLIYFFQKKAASSGLILNNLALVKSSQVKQEGNLKEIVFSINLMGSYPGFRSFLLNLEQSARLFEVNNISFASQRTQDSVINSTSKTSKVVQPATFQTYPFRLEIKTYSY